MGTITGNPGSRGAIRTGQSVAADPVAAVRELRDQVAQPGAELVLFFCSSRYDLDVLAREINTAFAGTNVVGCTTAGEIGPAGYLDGGLSGVSLPSTTFTAVTGCLGSLETAGMDAAEAHARTLLARLDSRIDEHERDGIFGFQMVDGLSMREELLAHAFQHALGGIPLVGGSAADAQEFEHTHVFSEGRFSEDSAVLVLAATSLPFIPFSTRHFSSTERRGVVTSANARTRTIFEIDGYPAVEGYARMVGVASDEVDASFYFSHPVVVRIAGADHARAIQRVNADGSLTMHCAIDEGMVLRTAVKDDLLADLQGAFEHIDHAVGPPSLVLACDCILRKLEMTQSRLTEPVSKTLRRNNAVGFSTYGEQHRGIHVNQTLTGIAFGQEEAA